MSLIHSLRSRCQRGRGLGEREKGRRIWRRGKREKDWEEGERGRGIWRKGKREGDFCICHTSGYKGVLSLGKIFQSVVFIHCVVFFAVLAISLGRSLHNV